MNPVDGEGERKQRLRPFAKMNAQPAYSITPKILTLIEQIGEAIGRVEASGVLRDLRQQRINRVRQIHATLAMAGNSLSEQQVSDILEETWPSQAGDQASDQVADQVAALLAALRQWPKTAAELITELGLSHRPSFRKNYLSPAMDAGWVEMTHPESPTAKNQKYQLVAGRRRGK